MSKTLTNEEIKEIERCARGILGKRKVPSIYFDDLIQEAFLRAVERKAKGMSWRPGFGYHLARKIKQYQNYYDRKLCSIEYDDEWGAVIKQEDKNNDGESDNDIVDK
jgi:hypothetical protein